MPRFSLQFRDCLRHVRRWRDGEYADLVAARCDAIVEAKNVLAEGGDLDGAIEIHNDRGLLVSRIALLDVNAPASGAAIRRPRSEARVQQDAGLPPARDADPKKSTEIGRNSGLASCPS